MEEIKSIIENKTKCFFVSPHLDDAVFSAGEFMLYLSGKVDIAVINIFTSCGDAKNSLSARAYLKQCQSDDAKKLFEVRIDEDQRTLDSIDAKVYNLGYTEALWRRKKAPHIVRKILAKYLVEFDRLHPIYRLDINSGKVKKEDEELIDKIAQEIKQITGNSKNIQIFCPVANGDHVDHVLVREACRKAFGGDQLIYWSDVPYSLNIAKKNSYIKDNGLKTRVFEIKSDRKIKLCQLYESQFKQVIPDQKILYRPEVFYLNEKNKRSFQVQIKTSIDGNLLVQWKELWNESPFKNFFNSPAWFLACQRTFRPKSIFILACFEDTKMVGILPLFISKKYQVKTYVCPGNQYFDNSSVLLIDQNPDILISLIDELSKYGNFYLCELEQTIANIAHTFIKKLGVTKSSICVYLPLMPDPCRYISTRNNKVILKTLKEEQGNFELKTFSGNMRGHMETIAQIESESPKKAEDKDIFSDPLLRELYINLEKINEKSFTINLLYYKNKPICYRYGFIYGNTYLDSNTAYKSTHSYLIPGKIAALFLLGELVKMGIGKIDFSRGDNRFKREFTPYSYQQYSIFFSSNPLVMIWWKSLKRLKDEIEKRSYLFEKIRLIRQIINNINSLSGGVANGIQTIFASGKTA